MTKNQKSAKHCVVIGRVQGVFFRRATAEKAQALGVKGWVRNLDDGNVECYVCGEDEAVETLCAWLWQGPPASKVSEVQIRDVPWEALNQFEIIR